MLKSTEIQHLEEILKQRRVDKILQLIVSKQVPYKERFRKTKGQKQKKKRNVTFQEHEKGFGNRYKYELQYGFVINHLTFHKLIRNQLRKEKERKYKKREYCKVSIRFAKDCFLVFDIL